MSLPGATAAPAPPRSWWRRNWKWVVPLVPSAHAKS
jgi:hypothetical protein